MLGYISLCCHRRRAIYGSVAFMGMMIIVVRRATIVVLLLVNMSHCICSLPAVRTWILINKPETDLVITLRLQMRSLVHRLVKSLLIIRISGGARVKNPRQLI